VFLLWGAHAQSYKKYIDSPKEHCIIENSHPSPFSARVGKTPFIGSKCFKKANDYLKDNIDWSI